jgi:hypothetical protein
MKMARKPRQKLEHGRNEKIEALVAQPTDDGVELSFELVVYLIETYTTRFVLPEGTNR